MQSLPAPVNCVFWQSTNNVCPPILHVRASRVCRYRSAGDPARRRCGPPLRSADRRAPAVRAADEPSRSVGQRSDFTNNLEMHRVRVSAVVSGIAGDGAGRDGLNPKGVGVLGGLCQFRIRDHGFQCSPSRDRGGLRVCALDTPSFRFTWREALLGWGACLRLQTM